MSAKILNEYRPHVQEILQQWKEEDEEEDTDESQSSSDTKTKPEKGAQPKEKQTPSANKEEEVNDFKIDKERIKAAHEFEKVCNRLVFDPDNDGFNFGYERALTFKVRTNMFKIIRKEIISSDFKLFDQCVETLSERLREDRTK